MVKIKKKEIEELLDHVWRTAVKHIERDGDVYPVFFIIRKDGVKVFPFAFEDYRQKEIVKELMHRIAKQAKASHVVVVTEAWAVTAHETIAEEKLKKLQKTGISQDPERYEMLLLMCQSATGKTSARTAGIIRCEDGTVTLIDEKASDYFSSVYSFMCRPWRKPFRERGQKC